MNSYEKREIDGFFDEAVSLLGDVRQDVSQDLMRVLYDNREWIELCKEVRKQFGLGRIKMRLLRRDTETYFESHPPVFVAGSQFFKKDQLDIPSDCIAIVLDNEFAENAPFDAVVLALAHCMASVKLKSIGNPINRGEMSNITVMIMGYSQNYVNGHKYGYIKEQIQDEQPAESLTEKVRSAIFGRTERPVITVEKMGLGSLSWEAVAYVHRRVVANQ